MKDVGASLGFSSYPGHPLGNSGVDEVRLGKGCYVNKPGTISLCRVYAYFLSTNMHLPNQYTPILNFYTFNHLKNKPQIVF